MIANDAISGPYATPSRFRDAADACGYRFRLVRADPDGTNLHIRIANDGTAPLYHDAHPTLGPYTSPDTLRGLLPGATRDFDLPLPHPAPADPAATLRLVSPKLLPGTTLPLDR